MISDQEMLAIAISFEALPYDNCRRIRSITVELRTREPRSWAIVGDGSVLDHEGMWLYEPLPSSRDDEFLKRCRWSDVREAIEFVRDHMKKYPTGFKDQ